MQGATCSSSTTATDTTSAGNDNTTNGNAPPAPSPIGVPGPAARAPLAALNTQEPSTVLSPRSVGAFSPRSSQTILPKQLHSSLHRLFINNRKWREDKIKVNPEYFSKMAEGQYPQYLWIGCSDSRVPAEEITGLAPGDMFVHRNIGNLVIANAMAVTSAIEYAVEHLKVRDIIVCGHYGCGAVKAAVANDSEGILDHWLRNIRDVARIHLEKLCDIEDEHLRQRRLVELNTIEQCINVFKINHVQRHQVMYGFPRIHACVYDIKTGELKELKVDYQGYIDQCTAVYKLHSFPTCPVVGGREELQLNMLRHLIRGHEEDNHRVSLKYLQRAMATERDLFMRDEIEEIINYVKEQEHVQETEDHQPVFVKVGTVLRFFPEKKNVPLNENTEVNYKHRHNTI